MLSGIVLFIVIVAGYLILDGFDLGVGILHPFVAKTDTERRIVLNSIGPVWDGNEVWLVLAGGVLFAAFPFVYAALFSGFYLAMMLVLLCLILRAGRHRVPQPASRSTLARDLGLGLLRRVGGAGVDAGRGARRYPQRRATQRAGRHHHSAWWTCSSPIPC